jgi:hypothetical protein
MPQAVNCARATFAVETEPFLFKDRLEQLALPLAPVLF